MTFAEKVIAGRNAELEYCRSDIEYFIDTYGHIQDLDNEESIVQPFSMWPLQRDALQSIAENKLNVILKARQLGITWLVLHYAAHLMLTYEGRTVIGISQKEDDAKKQLVGRMEFIFSNIPALICEKSKAQIGWSGPVYERNALELTITFPSGLQSKFTGMSTSEGAGRSWTANLIILDEWAYQQFAEEIFKSGFPTVNRPTGGQLIGLSTIVRGSFFEEVFTNRDNNFNKIFIPWYADPRRDDEWYKNTKMAMGDDITQEYPATIEEALTVPGGSYFPEVNSRNTITDKELAGNVTRYVSIDYGFDMFSAHWIAIDTNGNAQVYREYDESNLLASQAADIIRSLSEGETIEQYLAPPDLWSRNPVDGKSRAFLWSEAGVELTKVSNDFLAGCANMKEWLKPQGENEKSKLTILDGCAPNLVRCLQKIQKDKKRPNVYAKEPHYLTHDCDSLRYFCVYWTISATNTSNSKGRKWTDDMYEDYENANEEEKEYLIRKWGEPT